MLVGREVKEEGEAKEVTFEEGKDVAFFFECPFAECSTFRQEDVNNAFQELVAEVSRFKAAGSKRAVTPTRAEAKRVGFRFDHHNPLPPPLFLLFHIFTVPLSKTDIHELIARI